MKASSDQNKRRQPWLNRSALSSLCLVLALGCGESAHSDSGFGAGSSVEINEEFPTGISRFRRLTHAEWSATVNDLFEMSDVSEISSGFRADPRQSGYLFDGNGDALEVDQSLWQSYQFAARAIAEEVVQSSDALSAILPEDNGERDEYRARLFIEDFGFLVHRRPLNQGQVDEYLEVFKAGATAYEDVTGFPAGIRLLIEAFLQSPYFLYRVEESGKIEDGIIPLDGYERAARLSYFLWGTMPDKQLFSAAREGKLEDVEGVRQQAERMMTKGKSFDLIVHFFEKVLEVERYESISPSEDLFANAPDDLTESALQETHEFLREVMAKEGGSLRDLLTSTVTYVNDDLAAIYGLDLEGSKKFRRVELNPEERGGVLTQIGFLAAHATSRDPDPIHRGVFVARRMSCLSIAAPPDNVPPLPGNPEGDTNRALVEGHTEVPGTVCASCHSKTINPFGFAFENYDAIGAYRTMDGSHPVDASAEVYIDEENYPVDDALSLSSQLAESQDYHGCFSNHLLSFALGRPAATMDESAIELLTDQSREQGVSFSQLMVEMSVAVSFLNRSAGEEP